MSTPSHLTQALTLPPFEMQGSVLESIISSLSHGANGLKGLSALRLIRVMRVIRLIGMVQRLATLVEAFVQAIKQVVWVGALMLILLYIFAVLGQGLFAHNAKLNDNPDHSDTLFATVPRTMLTLFQIMSQDDWVRASPSSVFELSDCCVPIRRISCAQLEKHYHGPGSIF